MHACRRNHDIKIFLHDNAIYGLTTGQAAGRKSIKEAAAAISASNWIAVLDIRANCTRPCTGTSRRASATTSTLPNAQVVSFQLLYT